MEASVQTKSDLLARLHEQRATIRALGVARLGLFGSFATGRPSSTSDVDLIVEFASGQKSFDRFMALAELLERTLQRPVELVTPEALSPHIGPRILDEVEYVEV